jgi:predicted nucleic acid-binding protein
MRRRLSSRREEQPRAPRVGQFVDTSGWVALYDVSDANHLAARAHWQWLQQQRLPIITTDYILDEAITLARFRAGHQVAVRLGTALLTSRVLQLIPITPERRAEAWRLFQQYDDQAFSFTDCTSFAVMRELGLMEAFTFDLDFERAGFVRRP